ncbi:hypothetical protein G647_01914 [Cladophialophora carrionii CBS 160.54]|uniref:Btz domain-containing protein n=1 Tax=Cladophialophora carrionii CBS 160.54 TaxID=1279043 RepID=V9DS43_9EURO|nr:uncharacterized protein G647_01914 [Cladophialophora carrionii CBS 160.54]ETI29461.1 hypothetical protein G647_01914 [Cladophialophora carrionii CBS 160.54]
MPALRRKDLLASRRRRRQDEGEEEESVLGDFEDDSLSEGSAVSNGEDEVEFEGSESSGDERDPAQTTAATTQTSAGQGQQKTPTEPVKDATRAHDDAFKPAAETQAMQHGVNQGQQAQEAEQLQFDNLPTSAEAAAAPAETVPPKAPRNETPAQRARREHQEYIRQRNADPAFVPTRGGFFLHDDRNSSSIAPNARPPARGRGRGHGPPMTTGYVRTTSVYTSADMRSRAPGFNEPTDKPWAHDLHDEHENEAKPERNRSKPTHVPNEVAKEPSKPTSSTSAPNRSFSFTTVLGNVNVQVSLPGMAQKVVVPNVVKKHHTLLPQHRPPLRRDKPVRVSIPDAAPRYIFPSTDRSFIFIPRALRPNQQGYARGRGRGSFNASRRPSIYGGGYTPSVAMSRKSSLGASTMRDGIRSPTDSVMSRHVPAVIDGTRPVVRMPSAGPSPALMHVPRLNGQNAMPINHIPAVQLPFPAMYGGHSTTIPMHQPRPQKAVSLADIESPASFPFKAPQQQQEQPFHQQVPAHYGNQYPDEKVGAPPVQPTVSAMASATPLSQIPEGAVFAPGFQPYPVMGGPAYFGAPYNNGPVFYPSMADTSSFGPPMGGPALAPNFIPGSQSHPVSYLPPVGPSEGAVAGSMMAHETNGMVYYYNPTMFAPGTQSGMQQFPMAPNGNMMPLADGMSGQAPFYYTSVPTAMFYPTQSG